MHIEFTLDVNDPQTMIDFWSQVLRYDILDQDRYDDPDQVYWMIADPAGRGPRLVIQRVPEPVTCKTRVHIDVHVPDIEAEARRAIDLGATRVDESPLEEVGAAWIRLTDPEGNLFCFVREASD
ncbi:MAG: VOC family protein [Actinobacteria bacterium]|nr:VOC family protein [Actinomycetota bacterium]